MKLASLPTGEAMRPTDVRRIRIETALAVARAGARRYRVVVELGR